MRDTFCQMGPKQIRRHLCSWDVGSLKTAIEIECLILVAVATQLTKVS